MRIFKVIAVILFLFLMGSVSSAGEYEKLTDEQRAELKKGEAVYEYVKEVKEDGTHSGYARSMVLMKKPIDEAWKIFIDFGKSHEYFPRQTETEVLESSTTSALIKKVFEFYVVDISYYIKYDIDRKDGLIKYDLDKSRPHDLEEVQGYFRFEEIDKDTTLFIYGVTRTETGRRNRWPSMAKMSRWPSGDTVTCAWVTSLVSNSTVRAAAIGPTNVHNEAIITRTFTQCPFTSEIVWGRIVLCFIVLPLCQI